MNDQRDVNPCYEDVSLKVAGSHPVRARIFNEKPLLNFTCTFLLLLQIKYVHLDKRDL